MALDTDGIKDKLILTWGQDFQLTVNLAAGDELPEGTTAEIIITDGAEVDSTVIDTWAGVVSTTAVNWWVQSEDCDPIPDRADYRMLVHIPQGGDDIDRCWYYGKIARKE